MILYLYKNNTLTHPDLHFICLIFVDIKPAITGLIKSSPSAIQTTGTQNPQQGNGCVPKLMCLPKSCLQLSNDIDEQGALTSMLNAFIDILTQQ